MSYTIKEIIDIAIGIEESGYEFYTRSAMKLKEPHIKDVFDFLAREEKVHRATFQTMEKKESPAGLYTDEYFAYLKAIGGGRVFDGPALEINRILAGIITPMDALRHAFNAEKESILFYSELEGLYAGDTESISLLDKIIAEERKHVATLVDLAEKFRLT
jgi:rubrerythrin